MNNSKMGKHYNPQELLRGFTHPVTPEMIWQFDKKTGKFSQNKIHIKRVAQERDFYLQDVEDKLTKEVEIPGNKVLHKLRSEKFDLSEGERFDLSVYIATMIRRVPQNRIRARAIAPRALVESSKKVRNLIRSAEAGGLISPGMTENHLAEADIIEEKLSRDLPNDIISQIESPWPSPRMVRAIFDMEWRFLCSHGDHSFVTSDNPAFFFECWGLHNKNGNSEFTFPISADLSLFGSWEPIRRSKDRVVKDRQIAKEANNRIVVGATRFVFSKTKEDWIPKLAKKTVDQLNRVKWYPDYNVAGLVLKPGQPSF